MPIYEYLCLDCEKRFEALRPMKDSDEPIACSSCEGLQTSRCVTLFYAQSGGRVVAGGNSSCAACSSNACASCNIN
jgi:putative FmdB family regulatory protein